MIQRFSGQDTPLKLERTGNSNFPPVNTILSVRNICRDKEDKMFDFGVGIYNGEELEKVYVAARNLEFANEGYIDNIDVSLNFGEGMADGLYHLYGVIKSLAIDDQTLDPTGIKAIKSKADESNEENTYNLSGQRVSGAYKGIVIKNGIKVVK